MKEDTSAFVLSHPRRFSPKACKHPWVKHPPFLPKSFRFMLLPFMTHLKGSCRGWAIPPWFQHEQDTIHSSWRKLGGGGPPTITSLDTTKRTRRGRGPLRYPPLPTYLLWMVVSFFRGLPKMDRRCSFKTANSGTLTKDQPIEGGPGFKQPQPPVARI